jgi:ubiquinone/menaquinone biosynthesis C-methylase UbiE
MKIDYRETTNDLLKRIDIHSQYGSRNIDEWMLAIIQLKKGMKILDVGCGAGKQCFSYHQFLEGDAEITGGDVNLELLTQAKLENEYRATAMNFIELDFNKRFPMDDNQFNFESCCFAIYYAEDIPFTIKEMHRVLKPGGRLFSSGPMPENKQFFYEIICEATGKQIPPMPGSSRYSTQILDAMKSTFNSVDVHIFENPLVFNQVEPFLAYTRASLSEDRKLWSSFFETKDDFERIMKAITEFSEKRLRQDGKLIMTKVVGGFIATK